jgi:diguanylate cyclase (GGDEF)-like protein/PAS domain S-box-containing protein
MEGPWVGLLANLGIISISVSIWAYALDWIEDRGGLLRAAAISLIAGITAAFLMVTPFELRPGIYFDLRSVPIAIAGFLGGPVAGIATATGAALVRTTIGGIGAPAAIIGIGVVTIVGVCGHFLLQGRIPRRRDILPLAPATAIASLSGFFFLPDGLWREIMPTVAAPAIVLVSAAQLVAGMVIATELRRREETRTNLVYRAIIDALPEPLNAKDRDGRFIAANPATAALMQAGTPAALIGRTDRDFYPPEVATAFERDEETVLASGGPIVIEQAVARNDGFAGWLSTLKAPLRGPSGEIIGLITHNRDISERKRLEEAKALSERRLNDALTSMADALVMFDADGRLVLCNERYRELFPRTAHLRIPGARFRDILRASIATGEQGGVAADEVEAWIENTVESLRVPGEGLIELGGGRWLQTRVRTLADGGSLSVLSDVTAIRVAQRQLSELNRRLEALAMLDGLTGLMNRRAFDETIEAEFRDSVKGGAPLSLLLLDVDRFKAFNDRYGHPAGDACLRSVADILARTLLRPLDRAARYGGEEFAAILPQTPAVGAETVAEAVRRSVRAAAIPHADTNAGVVTISVGIATFPGTDAEGSVPELIRSADAALYRAKAGGRDRVMVAPPMSGEQSEARAAPVRGSQAR